MHPTELQSTERDERLGEAVEAYMELTESGNPPDPSEFVARYPDLGDDLAEALDGLSMMRGLVGEPGKAAGRLECGRRLAGYRIVRELGAGGMGIVYEAVHVDLDRPVALKVLDARATPDSRSRHRFEAEAKLAAGLHHTHIVPVFDVGHVGALYYYAMQKIDGCGLDRILRGMRRDRATGAGSSSGARRTRSPALPPSPEIEILSASLSLTLSRSERLGEAKRSPDDEPATPRFVPPKGSAYYRWVADVGRQAAQALAHAHRQGVIHRDIKPSNLLVDERGTILVTDFGLARRLADPGLTKTDSLLGTPRYMSPEQTRGGPIDGRADQFSLGATLYELLTLRPPFDGKSAAELVSQINERNPLPPRAIDPRIPRDLETIVLKALSKRPGDRYASTAELAEDLIRFSQHEPVQARRIGPLGRSWRMMRRHPAVSVVTAVATALVLATAGIAYDRVVEERDRLAVAQEGTKQALNREKEANVAMQTAMRKQMLSEARLVRTSHVPNRRERGLDLLTAAASSEGVEPSLKAELRDTAIEFLAMRDIQKRPNLSTERLSSLTFTTDGERLATLDEDGEKVRFLDLFRGTQQGKTIDAGPSSAPPAGPWGRGTPTRIAAVGPLTAVVWPDGRGLRLLESSTGTTVFDIPLPDHDIISLEAATTPSGPRLLTVERTPADWFRREIQPQMRVNLWTPERPDAPLATLVDTERDRPSLPLVAFAPDDNTIAVGWNRGDGDSVVGLWDAGDGHSIKEIDTHSSLTALAFGRSGLIAAAGPGAVRLWDAANQVTLTTITPQQGFVWHLRFSPDGAILAVAGGGSDIELWDPASGTLVAALPTEDRVTGLAFTPDGRTLVASQLPQTPPASPAPAERTSESATPPDNSGSIAVWAIIDPVGLARVSGFEWPASSLAFSPDDTLGIAFGVGNPARFWSPKTCPSSARPLDSLNPVTLSFDPRTGSLIAADLEIRFYADGPGNPPTNRLELPDFHFGPWKPRGRPDDRHWIGTMTGTPDGKFFVFCRLHEVFLWNASSPKTLKRLTPVAEPSPGSPEERPRDNADRRPRGRRGDDSPRPFFMIPWHGVAISPDGQYLYLRSRSEFRPFRINGDRLEPLNWTGPKSQVRAMALSPSGAVIALSRPNGDVLLLDALTGAEVGRVAPPADLDKLGEATAMAFSPNGHRLAAGLAAGIVRLIPLNDRGAPGENKPTIRLTAHRGEIRTLAYSPDGNRLASSGADRSLSVWNFPELHAELAKRNLDW
jgi:serine/threonine protein kinase/WD40 repeat protein